MTHYVIDIDITQPATRLVNAKTRAAALQYVAEGIITVRLATAADVYQMGRDGVALEDAGHEAEAERAALRG